MIDRNIVSSQTLEGKPGRGVVRGNYEPNKDGRTSATPNSACSALHPGPQHKVKSQVLKSP